MTDLIDLLEQFNRKERFFLIGQVLDLPAGKFQLSDDFRKKLGSKLGTKIPCDASVWMDYHLDAVAASLWEYRHSDHQKGEDFPKRNGMVVGNQRDIDLLVAFKGKNGGIYSLVFIEAKGYESNYADGYARWKTKEIDDQMRQKACQLGSIFGSDEPETPEVKPYFCLMSHSSIEELNTDNWPKWMKSMDGGRPHWLQLCLPSDRRRVARCNLDGKHSRDGDHFRIVGRIARDGS